MHFLLTLAAIAAIIYFVENSLTLQTIIGGTFTWLKRIFIACLVLFAIVLVIFIIPQMVKEGVNRAEIEEQAKATQLDYQYRKLQAEMSLECVKAKEIQEREVNVLTLLEAVKACEPT